MICCSLLTSLSLSIHTGERDKGATKDQHVCDGEDKSPPINREHDNSESASILSSRSNPVVTLSPHGKEKKKEGQEWTLKVASSVTVSTRGRNWYKVALPKKRLCNAPQKKKTGIPPSALPVIAAGMPVPSSFLSAGCQCLPER